MNAFHLFERFGIELEYMIVNAGTLDVLPVADRLLETAAGAPQASDVERGCISWSNELVNHVVELKTTEPAATLDRLEEEFARNVAEINRLLAPLGGRLLPSAMHPWMDPHTQTRLWPHENSEVYRAFDRVFNCKGHGWSNLQSVHINLPFANDEEFGRLHAAIRLVLPILPALAASSPLMEGRLTGLLDNRLDVYRTNCAKIPSATGKVIPEPVFTAADYDRVIFQKLYSDIAPHDLDGVLQEEWLNARGAIARFTRNAIEIRVLDIQECPAADLAICRAIVAILQQLVEEKHSSLADQQAWQVTPLERIFLATLRDAERTPITDAGYLKLFGLEAKAGCSAGELWQHLIASAAPRLASAPFFRLYADSGPLARRICRAVGDAPTRDRLAKVYAQLGVCLAQNQLFDP